MITLRIDHLRGIWMSIGLLPATMKFFA